MDSSKKLAVSLFSLRVSVAIVMLIWTIDKFVRPEHAAGVFKDFYFLRDVSNVTMYFIGIVEVLIVLCFTAGLFKKYSYGIVLALHAISTFSSFKQYLSPYEGPNILFFAAWPMLAACLVLYLMRERDTFCSLESGERLLKWSH